MGIEGVKNIILVLSGKGGVGKSSVAVHLALALRDMNFKVGLLDIDLCGPSVPHMLGMEDKAVHQSSEGWMPVFIDPSQTFSVMSIGFLLNNRNDPVIWRGPRKNAMIKQFLEDVYWQELDFLVIDMPPGTSDEHITLSENLKNSSANTGAVLVTTPQLVAIDDVLREITFCRKATLRMLGIIENMSGFECPNCKKCTAVFSQGGGESLAKKAQIPFLGAIPLDPKLVSSIEKQCKREELERPNVLNIFQSIAKTVVDNLKTN